MLEVLKLFGAQFAVAALLLSGALLITRASAPKSELGFLVLTFVLTAIVLVAATWGIFIRPWWWYALLWGIGTFALLFLSLALFDFLEPGAMAKIGPGGTVAMLPLIAMFLTLPGGGVLQWLLGLAKR
jgi:hypothetical protein